MEGDHLRLGARLPRFVDVEYSEAIATTLTALAASSPSTISLHAHPALTDTISLKADAFRSRPGDNYPK